MAERKKPVEFPPPRERQRTGNAPEPLVHFLYLLIRDHLPAGKVESVLVEVERAKDLKTSFSNGYLADYASLVADNLMDGEDDGDEGLGGGGGESG